MNVTAGGGSFFFWGLCASSAYGETLLFHVWPWAGEVHGFQGRMELLLDVTFLAITSIYYYLLLLIFQQILPDEITQKQNTQYKEICLG